MFPLSENPHCTDKSNRGSEKGADLLTITQNENGKGKPRTPASCSRPPDLTTESHRALGTLGHVLGLGAAGPSYPLPTPPARGHFPWVLESGLT